MTGIGQWLARMILLLWVTLALLAPLLPLAPNQVDLGRILAPPQIGLWLGADELGRPVLDRLLIGAQMALLIGIGVVGLSALIGTVLGAFAAFVGGWWDHLLVRVIDVFLAMPGLLLAIALAGLLGPGGTNLVLALVTVGWVGYARLARAQILSLRRRDHIQAARALGVGTWPMIWRHLLPLAFAPLLVEATFGVAAAIVAEAGLSFLGLGVQPPAASWGTMIRDGVAYMLVSPHLVLAPGVVLMLVVLAVNLVGDQFRDHLDSRMDRF